MMLRQPRNFETRCVTTQLRIRPIRMSAEVRFAVENLTEEEEANISHCVHDFMHAFLATLC